MICGSDFRRDRGTVNTLAWGRQRKNSPFHYVAPSYEASLHDSLHGAWWILEFVPKLAKYKQWPDREVHFGVYIPDAEPRPIPEDALIHESVVKRMDAMKSYRPVNLPTRFQTVPMPEAPEAAVGAEA